jgi:hypothetical protein
MAGVSSITGDSIYTAFSNYGAYAGQSSTTSVSRAGAAIPPSDGNGPGPLTGSSSSTQAAWLAGAASPGSAPDAPGQFLDTLA